MNIQEIKAAVQAHVDCGTDQETRAARDHLVTCLEQLHRVVPDWRLVVLELIEQNEKLGAALLECADSLESSVINQYHGESPDAMHLVTLRQYYRDMHDVYVARDTVFGLAGEQVSCVIELGLNGESQRGKEGF
ncbi:hypothetical protein [Pseudomonas typographi]|uniref:hypothetical protein n=1 Tax=Pseudomonas typographi TaxID=2715964 RepID=UPI0016856834|nr:hypothetical protein [Pseudomonas typographi]MBD1590234.1 hypothetical protein [Pseudomonas typographi]